MGIFGWSYPPGCDGPPEENYACMICGKGDDDCDCPPCPGCGDYGNPKCYGKNGHGLRRTIRQIKSLRQFEKAQREAIEAELKWAKQEIEFRKNHPEEF